MRRPKPDRRLPSAYAKIKLDPYPNHSKECCIRQKPHGRCDCVWDFLSKIEAESQKIYARTVVRK